MARLLKRLYLLTKNIVDNPVVNRVVRARTLSRSDICLNQFVGNYLKYGEERAMEFPHPKRVGEPIDSIEEPSRSYSTPRPFVFEVKDAQLVGPDALTLSPDGQFVLENSLGWTRRISMSTASSLVHGVLPIRRPTKSKMDLAVSLVGPWSTNYYHWFIDYLPRLEGLEVYRNRFYVDPILIIPKDPPEWLLESLELLGFHNDDYVIWDGGRWNIDRLVVPSLRRGTTFTNPTLDHPYYSLDPGGLEYVRRKITEQVSNYEIDEKIRDEKRIFISREQASERRVQNRSEVNSLLRNFNIRSYVLEEMSVAEQVALFSNAELVVGPHGAGLTNILFSSDTAVISLYGEVQAPMYYVIASILGFDFGYIKCNAPKNDLFVDVDNLGKLIKKMGF